jgi:hypothetical protein
MKTPFFAKDTKGKWRIFPIHLLEESRGQQCIIIRPYHIDKLFVVKDETLTQFYHLFERPNHRSFDFKTIVYRLKDQS